MLENWVRDTFETYWLDGLERFNFKKDDVEMSAIINVFVSLFREIKEPTYDEFMKQVNDDIRGWEDIFKSWKEQGILN